MESPTRNFNNDAARVSWFALLSYAVDYSFQLVDIFWVAKIGPGAPTAVALISSVFFLILALNEIIGVATVAIFSQAFGSGDMTRTGTVILRALILKAAVGLLMCALFAAFIVVVVPHYAVERTVQEYMYEYASIIWVSLFILPIYSTLMTALRATRDEKKTAIISVFALVLNAALNPALIFGFLGLPGLGLAGSALATVIAQVLALVAASYYLLSNRYGFRLSSSESVWQPRFYWNLIKIGLPIGGVTLLYNSEQAAISAIVATYPQSVSDGYSVAARIYGLIFMANFGIASGVSVTVGQFIGRGQVTEVQRSLPLFASLSALVMAPLALLLFLQSGNLIATFVPNPISIEVGKSYLRFMAVAMLILCVVSALNGAFEGAGKNGPVLGVAVVTYLGIEAPLLTYLLLAKNFDLEVVWALTLLTAFCSLLLSAWLFHQRLWQPRT